MQIVGEIERVDASQDTRIREAVREHTPLVITGMVETWLPFRRWSRQWLLEHVGSAMVEYRRSPSSVHPQIGPDGALQQLPNETGELREHIERIAQSANVFLDANLVCLASRRGRANHALATLLADVERPSFIEEADVDTIGLWLSGRGVRTRLHYDRNGRHNWNAQLAGRKELVLVSPTEIDKLYPFPITAPTYNFTRVDNFDPDLRRYPRFAEARGHRGTLTAGDLLFLPALWYHSFTHEGDFNLNLNFWTDARTTVMSPASLRNELATILLASIPVDEQQRAPWRELVDRVEQRCLRWSPRRATIDEIRSGLE